VEKFLYREKIRKESTRGGPSWSKKNMAPKIKQDLNKFPLVKKRKWGRRKRRGWIKKGKGGGVRSPM